MIFIPIGGGVSEDWWNRLAPLGCPEFHLLDSENEPETNRRRSLVARIARRPGCQARLTSKRALENFLHPAAIQAAGGPAVEFDDRDCVADRMISAVSRKWPNLSPRTRQRLRFRAKKWLNTRAVDCMTSAWLAERDPAGEVIEWLSTVISMAGATVECTQDDCSNPCCAPTACACE
jgi:hypothetical protein